MLSKDGTLPRSRAQRSLKSAQPVTMGGIYSRCTCLLLLFAFCSAPLITEAWKCKGCSALECKPTGSCSASDGEMQPAAAPWFFYNDAIVQQAWAACAPPSCPLIELPCGHFRYSGTYSPAKYDVAVSCDLNGVQCVVGLALRGRTSSSLSRILQLSLTPSNSWIQVSGNSSCGGLDAQLRCSGNARLWLRGGMYTGQEHAWAGVASFRCISCDSAVSTWMPPTEVLSAFNHESNGGEQIGSREHRSASQYAPLGSNDSAGFDSYSRETEYVSGACLPLSACLAVGKTASDVLLAVATACADDDCHRYLLLSTSNPKSPLATHIFSFASIQRAVLDRHVPEIQLIMRSGPALRFKLPLSSCSFAQHLLLELQHHAVLIDDAAGAFLNSSCTERASLVLHGDSACVHAASAAAAHHTAAAVHHMATAWHEHVLHLQIVSGSHISQKDAEASQLKLQMQARDSLCANEAHCDIISLSCDGAFIATSPSRIVVAKLPLDQPARAHLLSRVSSVDTMEDGAVRLFFAHDGFLDHDESHVRRIFFEWFQFFF
jgi:hypothetical protein